MKCSDHRNMCYKGGNSNGTLTNCFLLCVNVIGCLLVAHVILQYFENVLSLQKVCVCVGGGGAARPAPVGATALDYVCMKKLKCTNRQLQKSCTYLLY